MHSYDPPDLMTAFNDASVEESKDDSKEVGTPGDGSAAAATTPVQVRQLEKAAAEGLLVDLSPHRPVSGGEPKLLDDSSPLSVLSEASRNPHHQLDELCSGGLDDGEDSDDDLL